MRIAVGGFLHETNTFVASPTTWDDFERGGALPTVTKGELILSRFRGLNVAVSHFMAAVENCGHRLLPLAWAAAQPGGRVTDDAFERISGMLLDGPLEDPAGFRFTRIRPELRLRPRPA